MSNEPAPSRLRLVAEDQGAREQRPVRPAAATPQVAIIPLDRTRQVVVCEFAFEIARALAAQTARTGAVVFAGRAGLPKSRSRTARSHSRGPLTTTRLEPHSERDGVLFFERSWIQAVSPATRGQMPQVAVLPDHSAKADSAFPATAVVLAAPLGVRREYVELLRGELVAKDRRPVHVVELDDASPRSRFTRRGPSAFRAQAWELAAELVLA